MTQRHDARTSWKRAAALATALLLVPVAAPAFAHGEGPRGGHGPYMGDHDPGRGRDCGPRAHRGRGHGHEGRRCDRAPVYRAPVRVPYYQPYGPPALYVLPTAQVVVHGPGIAATVVYYPDSSPPVYAPGYCPAGRHYHPYLGDESGVHGSVNLRFRF